MPVPDFGTWTVELPAGYKWKYDNDHGKLLQYNVRTVGCDLWYLNGKAITGATGSEYTVSSSKPSDSGDYYLVVAGACDTVQSTITSVSIGSSDIIVQKWENVLAVKCVPSENDGY